MYGNIPLAVALSFIVGGLVALAWSSDIFVAGSASLARVLGVSPFVVGMVVIGFGTSAPELLVSAFSAIAGHSNLSLGNAYGSCIFNIAGILGVAAIVRPFIVKRSVARVGVPLLLAIIAVSYLILKDGVLSRIDAVVLLAVFCVVMPLYCKFDRKDDQARETDEPQQHMGMLKAALCAVVGLLVMIAASHFLVWGSVDLARACGVDELLIGLTVVAIGTSIPELASAIAAARRNESELVIGNIVGSNLFNMLAVVGIAGSISPTNSFSSYVITRDLPFLAVVTATIGFFGFNWRDPSKSGSIGRLYGAIWLSLQFLYMAVMLWQEI